MLVLLLLFSLVLQVIHLCSHTEAAFIASKHRNGIIVASDGRASLSRGLLVDVNEGRDLYKLTGLTYIACISSHSEFECLINDGMAKIAYLILSSHRIRPFPPP